MGKFRSQETLFPAAGKVRPPVPQGRRRPLSNGQAQAPAWVYA